MKTLWLALAATASFVAGPAVAQTAEPANSAETAIDPARLTAAKPVVQAIFPLGTYRRMMSGTLSQMVDQMMGSMYDMKAADLLGAAAPDEKSKASTKAVVGESTIGAFAESADPAFRQRAKITMDVMFAEMIPMMERLEPDIQTSLANIYARKFSATQLDDMARFFATPSGRAYADQSMLVFMDPEMMKSMQSFVPEFIKAMPDIMKKVEAATAHLPKPKMPARK
jgi:Uncharacterized protein conserved in bacteria (DUF2059)